MFSPPDELLRRSVNEVICHGIPDQRKLQEGDIINIGKLLARMRQLGAH